MKRAVTILLALAGVALSQFSGGQVTDLQKQFVRQRTKIVSRDTRSLPGYVINYFTRGNESWCTTNRLAVVGIPTSRKISKLKLIINLDKVGKWQVTKRFIEDSGYTDIWIACQYIDDSFPIFISATNSAVEAGIATDRQIKDVIEESYDE